MLRWVVVSFVLFLVVAPWEARSDELVFEGTVSSVFGTGPDLTSLVGQVVRACVDYDPTTPEEPFSVPDPSSGSYFDAIHWMRIEVPAASIDVAFQPLFTNTTLLLNDTGLPGVAETDTITFNADGAMGTTSVLGDTIVSGGVQVADAVITAQDLPPKLLLTAGSLPTAPLDLSSPGLLQLDVGFGFASFNAGTMRADQFVQIDPATLPPTACPEPSTELASAFAILTLATLASRRRMMVGTSAH